MPDCDKPLPGAPVIGCSALFGVIYCDPPWAYNESGGGNRVVSAKYPTMQQPELCALKLPSADNSVLFMWATAPKLREAFDVMDAWGYAYKTHAVWDKVKIGMGYWFRGQHELLMVALRGKMNPPPTELRMSSVIRWPRGAHSSKPDQLRDWIAKCYPNERKLEMFARPYTDFWPKHDGWETWGNELPNDVAMTPNDRTERRGTATLENQKPYGTS
jgi:N6-adenosine-specific RNA methylase IME4